MIKFSTGDESFIADKALLSIILGGWLLFYCFNKDVSGIKSAAFWGILAILFYVVLTIADLLISSWREELIEHKTINFLTVDLYDNNVYLCLACIILSFSFHNYTFSLYECLDSPDTKKMMITSSVGIMLSILIYLVVGTIDYIMYGASIQDSILDILGYNSLAVLENVSFVVNVVMSFPITFKAVKHYVILLLQLLLTAIKDCLNKKDHGRHKTGHVNAHNTIIGKDTMELSAKDDNHSINHTKLIKETDLLTHKNENDSSDQAHHPLVEIPELLEYLITLVLFLFIFYIANIFPNMKPVIIYLIILGFRIFRSNNCKYFKFYSSFIFLY